MIRRLACYLLLLFTVGCKKQRDVGITGAAYVRFFNTATYFTPITQNTTTQTELNYLTSFATFFDLRIQPSPLSDQGSINAAPEADRRPYPLVTLFIDPEIKNDLPVGGKFVGDFIGPQVRLYTPQADQLGDRESVIQNDFPGVKILKRAPDLGGIDLNRWAQITPGTHRIMLVYRPLTGTTYANRTPYVQLSDYQKALPLSLTGLKTVVVIDTTINLESGEVYTLESIDKHLFNLKPGVVPFTYEGVPNLDPARYSLLVRKETLHQQGLQPGRPYVRFLNNHNVAEYLPDEMDVYYRVSYIPGRVYEFNNLTQRWQAKTGIQNVSPIKKLGSVSGRFLHSGSDCPYFELDPLPLDSLIFPDGTLQQRAFINQPPFTYTFYFYRKGIDPDIATIPNNNAVLYSPQGSSDIYRYVTVGARTRLVPALNTFEFLTNYVNWYSIPRKGYSNSTFLPVVSHLIQEEFTLGNEIGK